MSDKPIIFISHSSRDVELVKILQSIIENAFNNAVEIYATSLGAITFGEEWFESITQKLQSTNTFLVLLTPNSIRSKYVWFEIGYYWSLKDQGAEAVLCPLYLSKLGLPEPLNRFQSVAIDNSQQWEDFLRQSSQRFELINYLSNTQLMDAVARISEYSSVIQHSTSSSTQNNDSNPYERYTDADLEEIIADYLHEIYYNYAFALDDGRIETYEKWTIFGEQLIHYDKFDDELNLPSGTAKNLLEKVAQRYNLFPIHKSENTIRFREKHEYNKTE